ncbi:cytochrome P450 [Crepidotus variabilis]|uniref:Cytochrome P450 n=1 Tax=Crepidotus variabilis TaxID=179855 RepID=A0A9P6EK38_9AGAR|nr:cytochrome P450 [Crepidotus variabilis]
MENMYILLASASSIFIAQIIWIFRKRRREVQSHPNEWTLFSPLGLFGSSILPKIKYISPGVNWPFINKHDIFARSGADYCFSTYAVPSPRNNLLLGDAAMIKEVVNSRTVFPKPVELYVFLSFFGKNIVVSEGEEWKIYRKIAAPAFSERNNKLVWDETSRILHELFEEVWGEKEVVTVNHFLDITLPLALSAISSAGFGKRMTWDENEALPLGHIMTFKQSLHIACTQFISKALLPSWAMGLTSKLRNTRNGFNELRSYMKEIISERQSTGAIRANDLLSNLLAATDEDSRLSEDELIGNTYMFLLAGHETTAHTLAFAFALLALYPEEQDKVHQQINSLLTEGASLSYEDMPKFTYSMAVLYETLRMFPAVIYIPKVAAEDTVLRSTTENGDPISLSVPKGTSIALLTPALHYNPRYWEDPHNFKPERFLKDWPRDAFLPFSGGPRACIGRKFAEVESIAAITAFISQYKVTIKEEPQFAHETFKQKKERVLKTFNALTLTPVRIPLVFTRRS